MGEVRVEIEIIFEEIENTPNIRVMTGDRCR